MGERQYGGEDRRGMLLSALLSTANDNAPRSAERPTATQRRWLHRGLGQPGGKLPLFDEQGRHVS